jgi:hypothetical protein
MFPDPTGAGFAEAVRNGADPDKVVPDEFVVVHGGVGPVPPAGMPFSGATGPNLEAAAAAVPHGTIRVSTVAAIRSAGGTVDWSPEISRYGTLNQQHVNIIESGSTCFSGLQQNPVARRQRIDGDKK